MQSTRINKLKELLKNESDDLFLNYALGIEYQSLLNLKQAEAQFKKVIELNPEYIAAYYQIGKNFEAQSKKKEALNYYKIGLESAKLKKDFKAINEFGEAIFMLED